MCRYVVSPRVAPPLESEGGGQKQLDAQREARTLRYVPQPWGTGLPLPAVVPTPKAAISEDNG